jgi:outer membrane lipoprotein-sorting protein
VKYFLNLLLVCGVLFVSLSAFAGARQIVGTEAETLLERIRQNQSSLKTISGSFVEERHISTMPAPLVFTGKVYARPPDFLFLAYEEPIRHIMKVTGDTVIFYVDGALTADCVNLQKAGEGAGPPNLFNWNPADFKGVIAETGAGYMFHNPEVTAGNRQIRITLDKKTLMVRTLVLQEPGGDVTTIIMKDLQVNGVIPEAILNYSLPAGVTIHNMGQ